MNLKKVISTIVLGFFVFTPAAYAENIETAQDIEQPVVENFGGISPLAWYDSLPRIATSSGSVNTSVTTSRFDARTSIYVVSNCSASYELSLEKWNDTLDTWDSVQRKRNLTANRTNESSFTNAGLTASDKCIVRLSKTFPGANATYSFTVFDLT